MGFTSKTSLGYDISMKTLSHKVTVVNLDGSLSNLEVSFKVGANFHDSCGVCVSSLKEISNRIKGYNGARILMKSDRHLVQNGNYILVNQRVTDVPRFFATMIQKSMSQLIEFADVKNISVSDGSTQFEVNL